MPDIPATKDEPVKPVRITRPGPLDDVLAKINHASNDVEARLLMNRLLTEEARILTETDCDRIRKTLAGINERLIFSKTVAPGDPLVEVYTVRSGDRLSRIGRRFKVDYRCLAKINGLASPDRILIGQNLKVIRGPFHVVIDKSDFRLDMYLTDPQGKRMYINSLSVGLGEDDSTPPGLWIVRRGSKVSNPQYTDPRSGKTYARNDKDNPIGEYWIGLEGIEEKTADLDAYGMHGTIDQDSIGKQASLGCIRLGDDGIELLYTTLVEGESTVTIKP